MICNEADINQKPVQTPCHLAVVLHVLSSILNAPSPPAHPALTLFSYLILETLTCVLSSHSLALSNLIFINAVTLLYQICISLPTRSHSSLCYLVNVPYVSALTLVCL